MMSDNAAVREQAPIYSGSRGLSLLAFGPCPAMDVSFVPDMPDHSAEGRSEDVLARYDACEQGSRLKWAMLEMGA